MALDAVLERAAEDGEVTVELRLGRRRDRDARRAVRGRRAAGRARAGPTDGVSLRRILDTVVDGYELDGDGWLELTKNVEPRRRALMQQSDKVLLRRYHEQGDLAAREQLIEQYMSLVRSLARRYSYRGEQLEDLVQIGAIGLIKAIDRFDVNRGVELTTYATPNIIGEIKRHFRDRGWSVRVPRGLQELNIQLSRLIEELTVQLGRSPTIPELAKAASVDGGRGARGARERPRVHARSRSRPARAATTTTVSSTRSSRSAPRSTSTRSRRTAPCSRRASACSTSASARSCTCASSRA